jgi:Tfp pilus assembly protein PilN
MNGTAVINRLSLWASASSSVLKKFTNPVARLLSFSLADDSIYPAKCVAASLDRGSLSVAYGRRFLSRMKIQGVREYSFDGKYPQPEVFASSLALAINDLGARNPQVTLSIPKAWTVITAADFPVSVKENLSDVIAYELDRITPFSSANAFFDYRVLGEKEGKLSVLIIAVKDDVIQPHIDALAERGIRVGRISVNLSGIETLLRYIGIRQSTIFLDLGRDGFEGALFHNNSITNVVTGNFSASDERSQASLVVREITPLLDSMKSGGRQPHIMAHLKDVPPGLKEQLIAQLPERLHLLNETDIGLKYPARRGNIPYAALGTVLESLWPKANGLNLLSKGVHAADRAPKLLTGILLLTILGLWIVYLVAPLKIEEKRLAEIDRQIALRKEEVKKVESLKKENEAIEAEMASINSFKEKRRMSLDILKELTAILPKSAWLSRVRVTETNVELEGYASSASGLLSKLESSSFFKKVEFSSPTFRDTRMNADRFNIKMEIEGIDIEALKAKEEPEFDEEE